MAHPEGYARWDLVLESARDEAVAIVDPKGIQVRVAVRHREGEAQAFQLFFVHRELPEHQLPSGFRCG